MRIDIRKLVVTVVAAGSIGFAGSMAVASVLNLGADAKSPAAPASAPLEPGVGVPASRVGVPINGHLTPVDAGVSAVQPAGKQPIDANTR